MNEIEALSLPGRGADGASASAPTTTEAGDMVLGNIDQPDAPTHQPAIERDRVPRLDVNDGRHVLLADQALDEAGKMPGQRAR